MRPHALGRLQSLLDDLRSSYWLLPTLMAVAAAGLAFGLVQLDRRLSTSMVENLPIVTSNDPDATRSLLTVIMGSMITVTGVVFSITVVALTLASSQFGPRLLRSFLRDRTNQVAFGTFVSTFLYALVVLRAVSEGAVPHVAATVAVLLAVTSLFVLIWFIHHTATSIQASSVIASVGAQLDRQLGHLLETEAEARREGRRPSCQEIDALRERVADDGVVIVSTSDGFIRILDDKEALRLASDSDFEIVVDRAPGDFVTAGASLARAGPVAHVSEKLAERIRDAFVVGDHRSAAQDLRFAIGQLTEVAERALSPGINDPRTAADCARRLGAVICKAARGDLPTGAGYGEDARLRMVGPALGFEALVGCCFDPLRRYGAPHVEVVITMFTMLGQAGACCGADEHRRRILMDQARGLLEAYRHRNGDAPVDERPVESAYREAMRILTTGPSAERDGAG